MSVVVVAFSTLAEVANQMQYCTHGAVPSLYCIPVCRRMTTEEITQLVNTWHRLNVETHNLRHPHEKKPIEDLPPFRYNQHPLIPMKFIKWITYVEGFIHIPAIEEVRALTPEEAHAVTILSKVVRGALQSIVINLVEYNRTEWPDE